jgi:hypothetical protein
MSKLATPGLMRGRINDKGIFLSNFNAIENHLPPVKQPTICFAIMLSLYSINLEPANNK